MNKKQWDKNQQYIAMAQKQAAKDAKSLMLGVPPKPVKQPAPLQNTWGSYLPMTYFKTTPLSTDHAMKSSDYHVFVDGVEIKIAWDPPLLESYIMPGSYASLIRPNSVVSQLADIVPSLTTHIAHCPVPDYCITGSVAELIQHLNDWHTWTREAIADWLDTLDVDLTVKPKEKEITNDDDDEGKEESAWQGATYVTIGTADYAVTSAHITKSYGLATGVA